MIVQSTAFIDGGMIPQKHTGFGEDISPEFRVIDAPDGTATFAIIMDDLDVPCRKSFNHWIIWNIPKIEVIPEGLPKGPRISHPINACQGVAWGENCYRGPKPPFFIKGEHRYVFTFYALDCKINIAEKSNKKILLNAMKGHVLAEAQITGKYRHGKSKG